MENLINNELGKIDSNVLEKFKKKYPDTKIPYCILCKNDTVALEKYGRGVCLEIGTFLGGATHIISINAEKIYTIDQFCEHGGLYDYTEYRYPKVKEKLEKLGNIEVLKGRSSTIFIDTMYDMIFIDGSHLYCDVKTDFLKFSSRLKIGGHVLFHDCVDLYPGVLKVCKEVEESGNFEFVEKLGIINIYRKTNGHN